MINENKLSIKDISILAFLLALQIVLSRFLSISALTFKIGFAFIPTVIVAILYKPYITVLFTAMSDFIGAILFPIGAYFVGFTITAAVAGLIIGYGFNNKNLSLPRILCVVGLKIIICSLLLNTYWITFFVKKGFMVLFTARVTAGVIKFTVQVLIIYTLNKLNVFERIKKIKV